MPVGMENRTLGDLSIFLMWAIKNEQSLNPRFLLWIKGVMIKTEYRKTRIFPRRII